MSVIKEIYKYLCLIKDYFCPLTILTIRIQELCVGWKYDLTLKIMKVKMQLFHRVTVTNIHIFQLLFTLIMNIIHP